MKNSKTKGTVAIIDDTPENLEILEEMLHRQGYNIMSFSSGSMALKALDINIPDLVLLDIMMPEMDGFEVCSRLKDRPKLKGVPVIFMSALSDIESKMNAFSSGGVDYVTKPFNEEEVKARVEVHLKLRKAQTELKKYSRGLEELVEAKVKEITESQIATIMAISSLVEFRDANTGNHIDRTGNLCKILSEKLRESPKHLELIDEEFVENIYYAAALHDIGKVRIPDEILLKPGKLTAEEFEIMKSHTNIGSDTLIKVERLYPKNKFISMGVELTRSHHERWDGRGYPDGLKGEEIPMPARIMCLSDVYDALRSDRPYKSGFSHEKSFEIICEESGAQFDPDVVDAFIEVQEKFRKVFEEAGQIA